MDVSLPSINHEPRGIPVASIQPDVGDKRAAVIEWFGKTCASHGGPGQYLSSKYGTLQSAHEFSE